MDQATLDTSLKVTGLLAIMILAIVAASTLGKINLGAFGGADDHKQRVAMKLVANVFIFLSLELILIGGFFKIFNDQVTLLMFVAGLGALGVKIIFDIKQ